MRRARIAPCLLGFVVGLVAAVGGGLIGCGGGGRGRAAQAPTQEAPVPWPTRVVVALDTSLSMGAVGVAVGAELAARIARTVPDVRLVTGDLRARACADPLDRCLAQLDVGGATDLGALLDAAFAAAGPGPTAIVLVSDGRVTRGDEPDVLVRRVADRAASGMVTLHAAPAGAPDALGRAVLAALAGAGRTATEDDVVAALARPPGPPAVAPGAGLAPRPGIAEDRVGDLDGDGVADEVDRCPAEGGVVVRDPDGPAQGRLGCPITHYARFCCPPPLDQAIYFVGRSLRVIPGWPTLFRDVASQVVAEDAGRGALVAIESHPGGARPRDRALGRRRAEEVRRQLVAHGVPAPQLTVIELAADGGDPHVAVRALTEAALRVRVRREEIEPLVRSTGRPVAHYLALWVRAARDDPRGAEVLADALAAVTTVRDRLDLFEPVVAKAWPDAFQATVLAAAAHGVDVGDDEADRFFAALAATAPPPGEPATAAAQAFAARWLTALADPDRRARLAPPRLRASADLLDWLGRTDEAARLRSELTERARP